MTGLSCLTVRQPWASLIAAGVKTVETRPGPPAGEMCPPGVRPLPVARAARGQRIGIHAAKSPPPGVMRRLGVGGWYPLDREGAWTATNAAGDQVPLPLGALVATAVLADCVRVENLIHESTAPAPEPWGHEHYIVDLVAHLALGDYTPGRWAWLLDDVKPTTERCPWCWGRGFVIGDPPVSVVAPCPTCGGPGASTGHCPPIPMPGRRGLWPWAGEVDRG